MKKSMTKLLSSTIAFTLVLAVSGSVGTAQMSKVQAEAVQPERAVSVVEEVKEEPKGTGIIEVLEEKMKAEIPVVNIAKAEAPAAPEVASPVVDIVDLAEAAEAEEVVAPEIEAVAAEEVAVPEVAEEAVAEEADAEWDISETASDNVTMKFYADAKEETIEKISDQVSVNATEGKVYIEGLGAMEESVYRHFMSVEKYLAAVEALFESEEVGYGVPIEMVYDPAITDVLELDSNIRYYDYETGEELFITEDMRWSLNPTDFLAFSPTKIFVAEGITNVSDYAFLCCGALERITLPSTIRYIGKQAFQYCLNLESVTLPVGAEIREGAFEYCQYLTNVTFANQSLYNGGTNVAGDEQAYSLSQEEIDELTGMAW